MEKLASVLTTRLNNDRVRPSVPVTCPPSNATQRRTHFHSYTHVGSPLRKYTVRYLIILAGATGLVWKLKLPWDPRLFLEPTIHGYIIWIKNLVLHVGLFVMGFPPFASKSGLSVCVCIIWGEMILHQHQPQLQKQLHGYSLIIQWKLLLFV